jgi:O-antigen chain-terminating methyltransferase
VSTAVTPRQEAPPPPGAPDANAFKYVAFEDRFRGSREEIRQRLLPYLPLFSGATNVVDIGCGRGEFLDLFREHGVAARGIDVNDEMVEACRARGLTADRADALAFLESQPDDSIGGLTAIQVVEHLEPEYLMRLIEIARHKLKPGAHMVLETINAACWAAFFDSYIRDFTHAHPIHPDTLKYLVQVSGFASTELRYLAPIAERDKLPKVSVSDDAGQVDPHMIDLIETVNAHADRLNNQLFTFRDFAVVARK